MADPRSNAPEPDDSGAQEAARRAEAQRATAHLRHELRTPINQVIGYAELLQEEAEEQGLSSMVEDLSRIAAAGRRLLAVIEGHFEASAAPSAPPAPAPAAAEEAERPAAPAAGAEAETPAAGPEPPRARLLVVDDDQANRDMLARRLRRRGYEVESAASGEAALERLGSARFDLVLLDVVMPGLSGLQVLEELRRSQPAADLPVVMATARDGSEDTVEALRLGANDYVTKPLDFPVVQARVETQLGLKSAMEQVRRLAGALEMRNSFIQRMFGRYVSEEVVSALLETPAGLRLGGEKRAVTILMADLRGFTALAERLPPEQVVRTLNNFLGAMTDIITRHQGTIDEFVGDAILVLFGAPIGRDDDARRAVACALEMQLDMESVNERNRRIGLPALQMGIGINTGEVVVGNVGSVKRAKYGVVGSPVNLAGRIESYTVGGQILLSEATLRAAGPEVEADSPLTIEAKGFAEPVTVFTLRGIGGEYGLRLPEAAEALTELGRPMPVRWAVLEGKHLAGDEREGELARLSMQSAEVRSAHPPQPMQDVRLRLTGFHGTELPEELYAKVTGSADGPVFTVRFTSVPPAAADLFRAALAESKATP